MVSINNQVATGSVANNISLNNGVNNLGQESLSKQKSLNDLSLLPDKRDIVVQNKSLNGNNNVSDFIRNVSMDIFIAKEETEINILNDKINSSDTTDSQKTILKAMLDDANVRLAKLKKEQGVK